MVLHNQSQAAKGLAEADWLAWSQGEGEVGRSFEEKDHCGAEVKLSKRLPLPQCQACSQQLLLGGGGGGQGAGGGGGQGAGIAAVIVGACGVARSVGLQLLRERERARERERERLDYYKHYYVPR